MDCYVVGDLVQLKSNNCKAKIKFIGDVRGKNGILYGVELESSKGSNNGTFKGIKYFNTTNNEKRGLFVKKQDISSLVKAAVNMHRITINDSKYFGKYDCFGFVKFIGNVNGKIGIFYGVELVEPNGRNNGKLKDRQYFKCNDNCGIFIKSKEFQDEFNNDDDENEEKEEKEEKFNVEEPVDPNMNISDFLQKKNCFSDDLVSILRDQCVYKASDIKNIRSMMVWNSILREVCKRAKGAESKKNATKILKKFEKIWKKEAGIKSTKPKSMKRKSTKKKIKPKPVENNDIGTNEQNVMDDTNVIRTETEKKQSGLDDELQRLKDLREEMEQKQKQIEIEEKQKALERERALLQTVQIKDQVDGMRKQLDILHQIEMKQLKNQHEREINQWKQQLSVTMETLENKIKELSDTKQQLTVMTIQNKNCQNELESMKKQLLSAQQVVPSNDTNECKECKEMKVRGEKGDRFINYIIRDKCVVWDRTTYLKWSSDTVVDWISTLDDGKFEKYEDKLRNECTKQGVDGNALPHITKEDLKGFGVELFMDRTNIHKHMTELTKPIQKQPQNVNDFVDEGTATAYH